MLVQGTTCCLHALKEPSCPIKFGILKAFNIVDCSFLLEVMPKMGFGHTWISLVCGLLSSASTRLLVNGTPGNDLFCAGSLRQGDPLLPLLFILVMEVLHHMFSFLVRRDLIDHQYFLTMCYFWGPTWWILGFAHSFWRILDRYRICASTWQNELSFQSDVLGIRSISCVWGSAVILDRSLASIWVYLWSYGNHLQHNFRKLWMNH